MAKKLQPDVIEWSLKLNSTQAQEEYHKLEKANRELQKENNATRKAMVDLEKQGKKGSQEWKNLKESISANNKVMAENKAKMEAISRQFDKSTMTANQLRKQLKELTREFNNTSRATDPKRYKELKQQIDKTKEALRNAQGSTTAFGGALSKLTKMKSMVVGFFAGIGTAIMMNITGAFRNAFKDLQDFELENTKLAAQLGTTKEGIKELTDASLKWEAATTYSATGVTQLQRELVKLGHSKDEVLGMTESVIMFAKITGAELPEAASMAASTLKIFGKDADDTKEVMATLAAAVTGAGLDFATLQSALTTLGPVAAQTGFSLEDTVAVLGMLQRSGLDATTAAGATRNMLLRMADSSGDLAKALGAPVKNAEELVAGMKRLNDAGVDLAMALELSDKRTASLLQTFIESGSAITEMKTAIDGAKGSFEDTYKMMDDNVAGALANLRSATDSLVKQLTGGTQGALKSLINLLTSMVNGLKSTVIWIQNNSKWIKTILISLAAWKGTQIVLNGLQKIWITLVRTSGVETAGLTLKERAGAVAKGLYAKATMSATTALKAFKATVTSLTGGIGLLITILTTAVTAIWTWKKASEEADEVQQRLKRNAEEHAEKRKELAVAIEAEKRKLLDLHKIAEDTTAAEEDRLKAIEALNAAIPDYNGYIDATTGKLKANTTALFLNIKAMEQRMRLAYFKDEYEKYAKEQAAADFEYEKAKKNRQEFVGSQGTIVDGKVKPKDETLRKGVEGRFTFSESWKYYKDVEKWKKDEKETEKAFEDALRVKRAADKAASEFVKAMEEYGVNVTDTVSESDEETKKPTSGGGKVVLPSKDKKKKKEKKEKKEKKKTEKKKDPIKEATAGIEARHQKELAEIEETSEDLGESEYAIKKAEELLRYCEELNKALNELKGKTKDTDILTKIDERQGKIGQDMAQAHKEINAAIDAREEQSHSDRLEALEVFYEEQESIMKKAVMNGEITQGAADIYLMNQQAQTHREQLQELRNYYKQVEEADYLGEAKRADRLEQLNADIRGKQREILNDTGLYVMKLREMTSNPNSLAGIRENYESQRRELAETYEAMKKIAGEGTEEFNRLDQEKLRRLLVMDQKYREEMYRLQEAVGLSWKDEWDRELLALKQQHAEGLIEEKDYQRKRLEIGVNHAKQYFDYYAGLSGSMFQAIQDAEIAMSDAKYDVLIRQAENNGEETALLEQEKENKKLEIQKKYADVNFAIKISQIIADTAVSIMKAFADLGPIGGAVAAAMLTATGAAQIVMANAERQKIKNLQPKSTASAKTDTVTNSATRVLSGFSEGGYTGDGSRYEVAGVVHKGEYVVPKPIMHNPRVVDAVGTIEAIRLNRMGKTAAFANGGYTTGSTHGSNAGIDNATPELVGEMKSMLKEMRVIFRNVKAYVVLQDLEKKQKQLNDARAPFTR